MALDGAGFYMIPEVDNLYMIFYFPMEELLATSIYDWEADSHVYAEYESGKNYRTNCPVHQLCLILTRIELLFMSAASYYSITIPFLELDGGVI